MSQRFELAKKLARELGMHALNSREDAVVSPKGVADYVTNVDTELEKRFTEVIRAEFPLDKIQGEELTPREQSVPRWIVDPIDGTKNYVHGFNMWSVAIGYKSAVEGESFGVVYFPETDKFFKAQEGEGAYLNDKKIHVSNQTILKKAYAHVDTFTFETNPKVAEARWPLYKRIFKAVFRTRNIGAASFSLCYTAKGSFDLNVNLAALQYEWDYYPPMIILKEAGGIYEIVDGVAIAGNEQLVEEFKLFMKEKDK